MKIVATAPCRADLAGGTLDIWPLYLYHEGAVTVNFAVDRYTTCEIVTRGDSRIVLRSRDLGAEEEFASPAALRAARKYRLPLPAEVARFFASEQGIELTTDSEAPAGAGISGSSSLIIATAAALNRLTGAGYGIEMLREIAQNIEARIIRVPTGAQDYYPAMYGGVSAIEFSAAGIERKPIGVDPAELDERFVLAYTGAPRNSGINNWEVTKAHIDGDRRVRRNFDRIAAIAQGMRAALERSDWSEAGRLLRAEWDHRRRNAPGISTPLIDRLIAAARGAGSLGAKVCGAGGGGCVVFLVERGTKAAVSAAIEREGAEVLPARVARRGVRVAVLPASPTARGLTGRRAKSPQRRGLAGAMPAAR
jgi:D-glycero-alpha-D-manno-heptose-7-phosphate kinase